MSYEFLGEGGPHKLRRTGPGKFTLTVCLPTDAIGMTGRECPDVACSPGAFKVKDETGITGDHLDAYCPYCRHAGKPDDFVTNDQVRYARDVASNEAHEGIERALSKALGIGPDGKRKLGGGLLPVEMHIKPTRRPPVRPPREVQLRRDVTCPYCTLEHAVYGLAVWCPDCGEDIFIVHVETEGQVVRRMLADVPRRSEDLGPRVAARDIENGLEDVVSLYEAALKAMIRRRLRADGKSVADVAAAMQEIRNRCQSFDGSAKVLGDLFSMDLRGALELDAIDRFRREVKAINECMFRIASHSHIHAPGPAMVESVDITAPLVTTSRGVSVLRSYQLPGGGIIRPGDLVEGFDRVAELREALEEASGDPTPLTILTISGDQRTITWSVPDTKRSDAVSSYVLPDGSLYVRIDAFSGLGPFDSGNAGTIRRHLRDAPGAGQIVIDLRGNPGGGRSAADTAALFVEGHATFALFLARDDVGRDRAVVLKEIRRLDGQMSLLPWDAIPQLLAFGEVMKGKQSFALEFDGSGMLAEVDVVILIDEGTRSAAEMLAGFLQEQGRATLIGRRSAGECALPVTVSLPYGWHAHVAACVVLTGGGDLIEGHGLEPDLEVIHEPADLALGRDRDIEEAMRHFAARRMSRAQAPRRSRR